MSTLPRTLFVAALVCAASAALPGAPAARADGGGAAPPAAAPSDGFDQTDRRKTMSIKLPRSWKSVTGEDVDPKALATFQGSFGSETSGRTGAAIFFVENGFARASLARAILLPPVGELKASRQGAGWAEGCAVDGQKRAQWRRYVEKGGRVYLFVVVVPALFYDAVHEDVEKLLDTAAVTGEYATAPLGDAFTPRKTAEFDAMSDAEADREGSVKKAVAALAAGRDATAKLLPGKPFDASRPLAWIFQNGQKYEDRVKAALGKTAEHAAFSGPDRAVLVSILGDTVTGHDDFVYLAAAKQYVCQYFGGDPPIWVGSGLAKYGQISAPGGGKGKLSPDALTKAKAAVVAGKRRLDEWFDVVSQADVTDAEQADMELFAWHSFFRVGKGAKKYRKQYDAYLQTLHDTGDPAAARKAFDGANFADMLTEFKAWAAEWK